MSLMKVDSDEKVVRRPESETLLATETSETSRFVDAVLERMFDMFSICRSRRLL